MTATPVADAEKPRRMFKPRATTPRLPPDQARRQGLVARDAWAALGGREAVMVFLNTPHPELGSRPIDLAVDSDAGLERVRAILNDLPPPAPLLKEQP